MQSTDFLHHILARPQMQMISIRQRHLHADFFQLIWRQRLDRGLRPDRDEVWCLYHTVRRSEFPSPRLAVFC